MYKLTKISCPLSLRITVMSLAISAAPIASAENLMDVYELALLNDAVYQAAQLKNTGAREAITQARAGLLPEISLRAQKSDIKQNVRTSANSANVGKDDFQTENRSISITQPLFNYSSWIRLEQANVSVKQAETEFRVAEQTLIMNVAEAYFTALSAQDRLEYASVEKTAIGKQLRDVKMKIKAGAARISDVHDAEARYALAESREIEMQNLLDDSNQALREHTRVFVLKVSPLKKEIPLLPPETGDVKEWIENALAQNLTLEANRLALEVARQEAKFHEASHYPTLDLVVSETRRNTEGPLIGDSEGVVDTTNAMLQFNFPFYQGGAVQSRMRQAYIYREKALKELEAQRRHIERQTRAAFRGVLSGIRKVQALKQSIISQKSALEVKTQGLKAGVYTLLQVLDTQRELYNAQTTYSQSRYDFLMSKLKLKEATGSLTQADLQAINTLIN